MPTWMLSIIAGAFALGILIFVHEWGHFIAARRFHVRVPVFSFGYGPRVWGVQRGSTDYRLSALPFGGYVRMAGDNPSEERTGAPDEFLSKPRWQRAIIILSGPGMNFILAFILLAAMFVFVGMPSPTYLSKPAVIAALPPNSPAAAAGILAGDRVVHIADTENPTWEQVQEVLGNAGVGAKIPVIIERGGQQMSLTLTVSNPTDLFSAIGYPGVGTIVAEVEPNRPAARAGLRANDQILSINGHELVSQLQTIDFIHASNGQPISVVVQRGQQRLTIQIQPDKGKNESGEAVWQIGALLGPQISYKHLSVAGGIENAALGTWGAARQVFWVIGQLFTGGVSVRQLQSVVGIAHESAQAVREGPVQYLELIVIISVNLGILNLLPIPILDGGHILLLIIEGMIKRDLSLKVKERFVQVGLVFLLVLIAIVMYNDVARLLPVSWH
ncbi:MAG: RIP metalloprotease RseP [Candidatus Acidiferrales bacterium]